MADRFFLYAVHPPACTCAKYKWKPSANQRLSTLSKSTAHEYRNFSLLLSNKHEESG